MAIYAPKPGEGKKYVQCPKGIFSAVCVDVVDLGMIDTGFKNEKTGEPNIAHKIRIVWQINKSMDDGRPFIMDNRYSLSLNEYQGKKSGLLLLLEAWGINPMDLIDETNQPDVERIIGRTCLLNVVHAPSKKDPTKVYANLASIMPLPDGMAAMVARDYVRVAARPATASIQHDDPDEMPPFPEDDIPF